MPVESHLLQMVINVESSPEILTTEKRCSSVAEVRKLLDEFLAEFGVPDAGPQKIGITITSRKLD